MCLEDIPTATISFGDELWEDDRREHLTRAIGNPEMILG